MKKYVLLIGFAVFCLLVFLPAKPVLANPPTAEMEIIRLEVLNGVRDGENTFDARRTVSGVSEPGARVTISVFVRNAEGEFFERSGYVVYVGSSGFFSQAINLSLGENVVVIRGTMEDRRPRTFMVTVNRMDRAIKSELESYVLPIAG